MIVHSLNLANFRGFEQIHLEFEDDLNVIAGVNGVGKSTVLYALSTMFSRALPEFAVSTTKPASLSDEDIRDGRRFLEVSSVFSIEDRRCHMTLQRTQADEEHRARLLERLAALRNRMPSTANREERLIHKREEQGLNHLLEEEGDLFHLLLEEISVDRSQVGDLNAAQRATQEVIREYKGRPNQPLVVYFSAGRRLPGRPRTLPEIKPFAPANAYPSALIEREVDLREFAHWFRVVESGMGGRKGLQVLDALREVVHTFVPAFTDLRLEVEPALRFVVEKNGTGFAVSQLSDGERGLLAMVFDLTRRLEIANPTLENPLRDGKAVVLIDEIELHLHPKWQREVLRRLQETFRSCQFIVTTHSPQVLGEVPGRCVRMLLIEANECMAWTPPHALGLDASRVLEELMDVSSRNQRVEAELTHLFRLIDDEQYTGARTLIEQLQAEIGADEPELTRACALMTFLEGGE